jgi:hypothetical protein
MGKENVGQAAEVLRFVALQPEDLGGRVADGQVQAELLDDPPAPAEPLDDPIGLGQGRGVVPQLGRPDRNPFRVQSDKAVLLSGYAQGGDRGRVDAGILQG